MKQEPMTKSTKPLLAAVVMTAMVFMIVGLVHVHRRHQMVKLGYKLSDLNSELATLEEESRRLTLEISMMTEPKRLKDIAHTHGLHLPEPEQIRTVYSNAVAQNP